MTHSHPLRWVGRSLGALRSANGGASAIEFALLAPILVLTLAATLDFGLVVHIRMSLNEAVSASTNYALVNAADVATDAARLASRLATIIPGSSDATIVVNNGPTVRRVAGVVNTSGSQAAANACYCPRLDGSTLTWGSPLACDAKCAAGDTAGQYVLVTAGETYSPMFNGYGIVENGAISVRSIARVK